MTPNTFTNNFTMTTPEPEPPKVRIIERIREAPGKVIQVIKRIKRAAKSDNTMVWVLVLVCCIVILAGIGVGTFFLVRYLRSSSEKTKKKSEKTKTDVLSTTTTTTTTTTAEEDPNPMVLPTVNSNPMSTLSPAPVTSNKKKKKKKKSKKGGTSETTTSSGSGGEWKSAYATYYNSYPDCCPKSPSYRASADKGECDDYSGCKYMGQFSGISGKLSFDQVKKRNIVSFYDAKNQKSGECAKQNKECKWWNTNVKGKKIIVKHPTTGKEIIVEALDTCNDADTDNKDCTKNAGKGGGTLIDFEIFTAKRFWGGKAKNGKIQWKFMT